MRIKNRFSNLRKPLYFLFSFSFICGSASLSKQDLENIRRFKQELFQKDNNITASQDNEIQNNLYSETKNSMVTAKVPATPEVASAPDVSIPALSAPPMVYEAAERQGQIGVFSEDEEDGIEDNFFTIQLPAHPTTGNSAYLVYDLYGLANHQSVPRSINRNPAIGGDVITASYQWATQKEEINPALLKSGKNTIHFTAPVQGIKYKIKNVKILFEPTAQPQQELSLSSVLSGDRLYVKGFVRNAAGDETVFVGDEALTLPYGEFEKTLPVSEQMKSSGQLSVRTKTTAVTHSFKGTQEKSRQVNQKEFKTHFFNIAQQPEQYFQYEGAGVEITDHTAVAGSILGISKLRSKDFPGMQQSIKNLTADGSAYRIGIPSGVSQQKIRVTLPYDAKKLGTLSAKEIKIFYFDYASKKWKIAGAAKVDEQKHTVSVETSGESQDYINGIISVPESPQLNAFAPTSISGLKAADPTAGLQFMAPPTPSQKGDANLSYPIVVPQGTGGLQPNLSISYNSGAGNGWMGEGWDISGLSSISIDTRWGSPEFDPQYETELYSLDGEMLVYEGEYMPHRHHDVGGSMSISKQSRGPGTKNFYLRRNHDFAKIERTGSSPVTYQWRITQTDGTISVYSQVLASSSGISKWALRSVEDVHGNVMNFNYDQNNAGHISSISYGKDASYSVIFQRETAVSRPDVRIDAKLGVKVTESYRLTKILVKYKSEIIRTYEFQYEAGMFSKTLLKGFKVKPHNDPASINEYTFDYYDDLTNQKTGIVSNFSTDQNINVSNSLHPFTIVPAGLSPSKINSNNMFESGVTTRFGIGVDSPLYTPSAYGNFVIASNFTFSQANATNMQQLVDFNGDGIQDILYRIANAGLYISAGSIDTQGSLTFQPARKIGNYSGEISSTDTSTNGEGFDTGINYGIGFNFSKIWTTTQSTTSTYLIDANFDGLLDIVENGKVWFNKATANTVEMTRFSEFTENMVLHKDSTIMPLPTPSNSDFNNGEGFPVAKNDIVKFWIAPMDGYIRINDNISVENTAGAEAIYSIEMLDPADSGASNKNRRIYLTKLLPGAGNAFQIEFYNQYFNQIQAMPPSHPNHHWASNSSSRLHVKSGDKVYIRLHKRPNLPNFKVQSNPQITYVDGSGTPLVNDNVKEQGAFHVNNLSYQDNFLLNNIFNSINLDSPGTATITIPGVTFARLDDAVTFKVVKTDMNTGSSSVLYTETKLQTDVSYHFQPHTLQVTVLQGESFKIDFVVESLSHTDYLANNWNNISVQYSGIANSTPFTHQLAGVARYPSYAITDFKGKFNISNHITYTPPGNQSFGVQVRKNITAPFATTLLKSGNFIYVVKKGNTVVAKRKVSVYLPNSSITEVDLPTNASINGIAPVYFYSGNLQNQIETDDLLSILVYCSTPEDFILYNAYNEYFYYKPFNIYYSNFGNNVVIGNIANTSINSEIYNTKSLIYNNYGQFLYNESHDVEVNSDLPDIYNYNSGTPSDNYGLLINNQYFSEYGNYFQIDSCHSDPNPQQCINDVLTTSVQNTTPLFPIIPLKTNKINNIEKWVGHSPEQYSMKDSFKTDETAGFFTNPTPSLPTTPPVTLNTPQIIYKSDMNAIDIRHQSRTKTTTLSGTSIIAGAGNSTSELVGSGSVMLQDFKDMNGDGYPDMVYKSKMQMSNSLGSHKNQLQDSWTDEFLSETFTYQNGYSASYSHNDKRQPARSIVHGIDCTTTTTDTSPAWSGAGASVNQFDANTKDYGKTYWMDLNGDGLPDRISATDDYSVLKYRLNMGNSLHPMPTDFIDGNTYLSSPVGSLGFNIPLASVSQSISTAGIASFGFGFSASIGATASLGTAKRVFEDINGDGLVDLLLISDTNTQVMYNLGNRFDAPVVLYKSSSAVDFSYENGSYNGSFSFGVSGGAFVWGLLIPPVHFKIVFGGSANLGLTISDVNKTFRDMNGDGYPDLVEKSGNGFKVNYSRIGRTNKLKTVTNTTSGGIYTIDYELKRATYANPHAKYVMSKVEILNPDAFSGTYTQSNPNKNMVTQFQYENPKYDRRERADFGFSSVTTNEMNGSDIYRVTKNTYYNNSYLLHGLLIKSEIMDGSGVLKRETKNEYTLRKFNSDVTEIDQSIALPSNYDTGGKEGRKMATALLTKTTTQDIENGQSITKTARFGYTEKGLINSYIYSSPSTTYNSRITYHALGNNIISIPASIKVYPGSVPGTHPLRERVTLVNTSNGDVLKIKVRLQGNQYAETDFTYDVYGNMLSVEYPPNENGQRVKLHYTYNTETKNFVTEVTDQSGMSSSAVYDYVLGLPLQTTDISGNHIHYEYDSRGRVTKILAPKEYNTGRDNPYTIKYEYGFIPHGNNQLYYAKTQNFDAQHPDNPIEILTIADFMGRVIQVKKDIDLDGAEKISVGGRTEYDLLGRAIKQYHPDQEDPGIMALSPVNGVPYTTAEYDVMNRTVKTTDADGIATLTTYSIESGQYKTTVNVSNMKTETFSNGEGKPALIKNYLNNTPLSTIFSYNTVGELMQVTDPENLTTTYEYDLAGRRILMNHPDRGETTYEYDDAGNLVRYRSPNLVNNPTNADFIHYLYEYNRLVNIMLPDLPSGDPNPNNVSYEYAPDGNGNNTGKLVYKQDGTGTVQYEYGNMGELVSEHRTVIGINIMPTHYNTHFSYDSFNRIQEIIYPDGEGVSYFYNYGGNLHQVNSSLGDTYIKAIVYDKYEQRSRVSYGNGAQTLFHYTPGNRRLSEYELSINGQSLLNNTYLYDNVGNITYLSNAAGPSPNEMGGVYDFNYHYDTLNRLQYSHGKFRIEETHTEPPQSIPGWSPYQVSNSTFSLNLEYNSAGGILNKIQHHEQDVQVNEHNTYDHQYNYIDGTHKINTIFDPNSGISEYFDYDLNGNMTYRENDDTGYEHLYWDEQDRLKAFHHPERSIFQYYAYDDKGERTLKYNMLGDAQLYHNGTLVDPGNLAQSGAKIYPNPYVVVNIEQNYTKHYFDGTTRFASRVEEDPNVFNQTSRPQKAGKNTIIDPNADLKRYLEKAGLTEKVEKEFAKAPVSPGLYYLHTDHLGTATYVTNSAGDTSQFFLNLPFGETMAEQNLPGEYENPYKFNAKELDTETELYYYGARYYNPRLSVWYGVDPLAVYNPVMETEFYGDGQHNGGVFYWGNLNPYIYTYQNPIRYIDPNGKQVDAIKKYLGNLWDDWSPWSRAGSRMSGESERDQNSRIGQNTIRNINGLAKASATAEVGHVALDAIGTIEPTPIADTANAIWYAAEGDWGNAAISGLAIAPYVGDLGKTGKYGGKLITQIQKHHLIPQQLFKEMPEIGDFILKNSGINLKKLPNRFHGNHPAYTNWIRDRFSDLASEGNFNKAGIQGVIKKANSEINKAYKEFQKSGQSLNDYFKKK